VLDGYSRFLVHWDLRESVREADVEIILQRAKEKYPEAKPRVISDNGPQSIARDFKEFIRISGMTHVRTSPSYPQSNAACESFLKTLKYEEVYRSEYRDLPEARASIRQFLERVYYRKRLHFALGYLPPVEFGGPLGGEAP